MSSRCNAEYDALILYRISKDEQTNLYIDTDDDSIKNFLENYFDRYQGFQSDPPDDSLYTILDNISSSWEDLVGEEIKEIEADERGRRGDTTHKMLLAALSHLGYPNYYEDVNLIGHKY